MQRKRQDHREANSPGLQGPSLSRALAFIISFRRLTPHCVGFRGSPKPGSAPGQRQSQGSGVRECGAGRPGPAGMSLGGGRVPWGSGEVAEGKMIEAEGQVGPAWKCRLCPVRNGVP